MNFNKMKVVLATVAMNIIAVQFILTPTLAADIYNNDTNRTNYGSNYYGTSNLREWLNSDESTVTFSHNPPISGNINGNQNAYAMEKGFLSNFTGAEKDMIQPRANKGVIASIDNNVKDGGTALHNYNATSPQTAIQNYNDSFYKEFMDRVFLLSVKEVAEWVQGRGWEYKAKPTSQAVTKSEYTSSSLNTGNFWHYWLRDSYASNSSNVRYVDSSGSVNSRHASSHYVGVRPALNLKSEISKSVGSGSLNDPATLGASGETLKVGDYIVYGKYNNQPILWRVINKDQQGTVLFSENILSIKPFDAKGDGTYPELAQNYGEFGEIVPPPKDVENITETHSETSVTLSWLVPSDQNIDYVEIYQDGELIKTNLTTSSLKISELSPNTNFVFKIVTVNDKGIKSNGVSITVKTSEIKPDEVLDVTAEPKHNRVNISWKLPQSNFFSHVNIYRKTVEKEKQNFFQRLFLGSIVSASEEEDGFTPLFETNGTYWNDLTVQPKTVYDYKLTTTTIDKKESEGVVVTVETLAEPKPVLDGGDYKKDENGDYLFTWTKPTTGKVKVLIDGKEYKSVDASLKELLIPKEDMIYDFLSNPKVQLIPISESGKEGETVKPGGDKIGGAKMPFGPTDLLKSTLGLLGVIAPILLLSLAIIYFRPIKNVIVKAVQNQRERKMYR